MPKSSPSLARIEPPALPQAVAMKLAEYPPVIRQRVLALREIVFMVAANTPGVGPLEESLKWGEPAFATVESKSGSTVRIAWRPKQPSQYAMYFNCQTTLVDSFKTMFPTAFRYEGNRALVFEQGDEVAVEALRICIAMALTYHCDRKAAKAPR
ncbi:DUF1801 domain-containing protein [Casimicrobium huifangae]|uniref:DUF1801 domain-containing protein n=1 Tax=Casimicrobium huifangae TaxID=2591109 RepID=UPI003783F9E6